MFSSSDLIELGNIGYWNGEAVGLGNKSQGERKSMKTKHPITYLLMAAGLVGICAINAFAQTAARFSMTVPPSSSSSPGDAGVRSHTTLRYIAPGAITGEPQASGPPFPGFLFETPASLACIYELQFSFAGCNPNVVTANPMGGGRAIAVVDAYDDANAFIDLQSFSAQFGVKAITPSTFQVVFAPAGGSTPGSCAAGPAPQPASAAANGWDVEESVDIEYAHAMAPAAKLYLVEAQTNNDLDLYCGVTVASELVAKAGGGEVSMSWGGGEFAGETAVDPVFTQHGVVYFASSGDSPGVIYPSASPNVVSVGGTTLSMNINTGTFEFENTWQDGGGGPSAFEPRPGYQNEIAFLVGSQRGTPDIAADANLNTGVWVLDTLVFGPGSWYIVGGTSVSAPVMAGIVNGANSFSVSSQAELTKMYSSRSGFNDITFGNCGPYNGTLATFGWDSCTGLGSPDGYAGK
jgi:subtilase family serine protease